jgi:hypothetical protein
MSTIVHVKFTKLQGVYCGAGPKGIEWVEPFVAVDTDPSCLRPHKGWTGRALCLDCIEKAKLLGHLKKKILYAVVSMVIGSYEGKRAWVPAPLRYTHGVNESHAKMVFFANHRRDRTKIVHIGQVVGLKMADKHGEVLFV